MGQYAFALAPSFLRTGRASRLGLREEGSTAATSSADPLRFFFFFPPEDGPTWGSEALASLTSGRPDCRSRASAALAHLSARAKSSVGEEITLVASFSAILRSRTPRRKAMQTDSPEILAIVFRHWQKRWMYLRRDSTLCCCTWYRSSSSPGRADVPWKLATNWSHRSSQERIEASGRFISQDRAEPVRAVGK